MMLKVPGYRQEMGIAMMMEHRAPGQGGRHRYTLSSTTPNLHLSPREALAREIWDLRSIYGHQGLYTPQIRRSLQQVIHLNKLAWSGIFDKGGNDE
jgi:hypothetical protein